MPEGVPDALPVLPENPTIEQLQTVLKRLKPTCAGIEAAYVCGNHDAVPQYSGEVISITSGDDIAMNSMVISVVEIDGSGNGTGIIKVGMLNNAKLGVALSGIKVAKGGCIIAGRAELNDVSISVLNDKQREILAKSYAAFQTATDAAIENAGAVAEVIDDLGVLIEKLKTDVENYVGGAKDALKMKVNFAASEQYSAKLLENKDLSDSTKAQLKAALEDALTVKDFFCKGQDCADVRNASKKGGPEFLFLGDPTPKCVQNKAKVDKLQQQLDKAKKELKDAATSVYDFAKQFTVDYGKFVDAANSSDKLVKNLCGEYLMFEKTVPNIGGNGTVTYLAPPKGKKGSSTLFQTEIEYYQYVATRLIYSDKVGCANLKIPDTHYLDEKFFDIRAKFYSLFNWEVPFIFKPMLLVDGVFRPEVRSDARNKARDLEAVELIDNLLSKNSAKSNVAYARIKEKVGVVKAAEIGAAYFETEFGGYLIGKIGGIVIKSPFFKKIVGYLGSKIAKSPEIIKIFRGTDLASELIVFDETGYIMSDAARKGYTEAIYSGKNTEDALKFALKASEEAHAKNIKYFGSLENYMKAHTLKGTELGGLAPRSMISFTTKESVTSRFGSNVFKTETPIKAITQQILVDGSESEIFMFHMVKVSKK